MAQFDLDDRKSTDNLQIFEIFEMKHKIGASFFWEHPVYTLYLQITGPISIFDILSRCRNVSI